MEPILDAELLDPAQEAVVLRARPRALLAPSFGRPKRDRLDGRRIGRH
jgi:hypothetical protein